MHDTSARPLPVAASGGRNTLKNSLAKLLGFTPVKAAAALCRLPKHQKGVLTGGGGRFRAGRGLKILFTSRTYSADAPPQTGFRKVCNE